MEFSVTHDVGKYQLLYFQPEPEDGERVCVAVLASGSGEVELLFDPYFPRARCIAPSLHPGLLRSYIEELQKELRSKPSERLIALGRFSPQLVASEERLVKWPLNDKLRLRLLDRFVRHSFGKSELPLVRYEMEKPKSEQIIQEHLEQLVRQFTSQELRFVLGAKPIDVVGRKVKNIRAVPLAIHGPNTVLLFDGVDLTLGTGIALSRITKVVHTFWQYGRINQGEFNPRSVQRIGVVMNGAVNADRSYREAHDFAIDQFGKESEYTIDASSSEDRGRLEHLLRVALPS